MADLEMNPNNDDSIARYKRLKKDIIRFAVMFFAIQMLFAAAVYPSPTEAKCRFRAAPVLMSLCAGLFYILVILMTSVSLVEVLVQLRDGGEVLGNWRIGVVVAGNVFVAVCLALFLWLVYELPCRGVRLN